MAIWRAIQNLGTTGDFRPNPSRLCDWCAHQSLCPAFGGTPPPYPGWPSDYGVSDTDIEDAEASATAIPGDAA
ncbi:RecB family exonuclease [Mycobacteroides abscessus subsp. massiliense]|nr:RecB family exonuclease [Mycobacteroides abscessus subsp. massiliense]